jgi:hypothetical protein
MASHAAGSGQESLFVAEKRSGQFEIRESESPSDAIANSLVEHDIQLQNVLYGFSAVNSRMGFGKRAGDAEIFNSYSVTGVASAEENLREKAEMDFKRAFGLFAIEASGLANVKVVTGWADAAYNRFKALYSHPGQPYTKSRAELLDFLEARVRAVQAARTTENRAQSRRPYKLDEETAKPALKVPETLDARARLHALNRDPRAGFLPASNNEKNKVMAFLDYLDNPDYPLGINNQLLEIFNHQARLDRPDNLEVARQAMVSIPYEIGDMLENGLHSLTSLRGLELEVDDCPNPRVPLAELEIDDTLAFAALVRYYDLRAFRDKGVVPAGIKDPLRGKENRAKAQTLPGKNKTVEDSYTATEPATAITEHIDEAVENLTVGKTRKLVSEAVADQEMRVAFMADRLRDMAQSEDSRYAVAGQTARTILKHLNMTYDSKPAA